MQNDFRPGGPAKPAPKLKSTRSLKSATEPAVPFETPDQVQAHDTQTAVTAPETTALAAVSKPRGTGHHWFNLPWPPNKAEVILVTSICLIAVVTITGFAVLKKPAKVQPVVAAKVTPKPAVAAPTTIASTLSGLSVAPEINQRPVVGVMIENSQTARPQSGLSQAGVVFEAVAEGGITRFLALFQDQQPTSIGPVRSARPYYVQWNEGFRAAYAHVGGSPDALADIKAWGVQDLNQFYNSGPFHRVDSRPAPHNMYSNVVDLANLATQKGYQSSFTGFERKTAAPSQQAAASSVDLNISSALYNVHYDYDPASNTYMRSEGGEPQVDANSNLQLSPHVVIAMVVPVGQGARTAQGGAYSDYNPIGSGQVLIFQDGQVTSGTWNKASNTAQITFTDAAGAAIKLNPGQTWISAVTGTTKVSYK